MASLDTDDMMCSPVPEPPFCPEAPQPAQPGDVQTNEDAPCGNGQTDDFPEEDPSYDYQDEEEVDDDDCFLANLILKNLRMKNSEISTANPDTDAPEPEHGDMHNYEYCHSGDGQTYHYSNDDFPKEDPSYYDENDEEEDDSDDAYLASLILNNLQLQNSETTTANPDTDAMTCNPAPEPEHGDMHNYECRPCGDGQINKKAMGDLDTDVMMCSPTPEHEQHEAMHTNQDGPCGNGQTNDDFSDGPGHDASGRKEDPSHHDQDEEDDDNHGLIHRDEEVTCDDEDEPDTVFHLELGKEGDEGEDDDSQMIPPPNGENEYPGLTFKPIKLSVIKKYYEHGAQMYMLHHPAWWTSHWRKNRVHVWTLQAMSKKEKA
ncbi:protein PFC0760c-like isoform X2 [Hyperolius riggenbachi]|uniref:protein PFC0760c-like isoform X2 n=1 Tax=Hyperolius riggenbachi TaxID=752182 RepID=UPI0035A2B611